MVRTGNYKNFNGTNYSHISISKDRGRDANYEGKCFLDLAPNESFFRIWRNNIGKISTEENNKYYIGEYYKQILGKLDPEEIYSKLSNNILLCYEESNQFCHRHIVAAWFEIMLGVKVPEVIIEMGIIKEVEVPSYIKECLEQVMKDNKNMRGFESLRALYLFEKSEEIEEKANEIESTNKYCDEFRQLACYLRCEADEVESDYKNSKKLKIKK